MKLIKGKKKDDGLKDGEGIVTVLKKQPPRLASGKTPAFPRTQRGMVQIAAEFRRLAHFHRVNLVGLVLDEGPDGTGGRELGLMVAHTCTTGMTFEEEVAWGYRGFSGMLDALGGLKEGMLPSPSAHYYEERKRRMAGPGRVRGKRKPPRRNPR